MYVTFSSFLSFFHMCMASLFIIRFVPLTFIAIILQGQIKMIEASIQFQNDFCSGYI